MRILLTASVAAAALFSAAAAQAQAVGHVGANYTHTEVDLGDADADADAWQVEGAAAFDAGQLGVTLDGSITDAEHADAAFAFTGHVNKNLGAARVGGFAGVVTSDGDTLWAVGAEGQADLAPNTVLYGQLGYGKADDLDVDGWAVRAELRQYFSENFKVAGSLGYLAADQDDFGDLDAWNIGVDAEYQFANTPFSVYGGYQRTEFDDIDLDADTFQIGVRYTFGGATLRARDAAGAALGGVTKLFGGLTN